MTDNEARAVPVEGDRDRLAAIRDLIARYLWEEDDSGDENDLVEAHDWLRDYLAGVSLTGSGLREAAQELIDWYDAGVKWQVARRHIDALRAALSGESGEPTP